MLRSAPVLDKIFGPILGKPCWGVHKGYGSALFLEFGKPKLEISERRKPDQASHTKEDRVVRRVAVVRGEYSIFLDMCAWHYYRDEVRIGDWLWDKRIARVMPDLNGQKLLKVEVDPSKGAASFLFDLGGRLATRPATGEKFDKDQAQWCLFCPNKRVFSYRADGKCCFSPSGTSDGKNKWTSVD